MDKANSLIHI